MGSETGPVSVVGSRPQKGNWAADTRRRAAMCHGRGYGLRTSIASVERFRVRVHGITCLVGRCRVLGVWAYTGSEPWGSRG